MRAKLLKKLEGFTIIEVMIVLAIAGLIMAIVFLAIPTLQRSSRNSRRGNDASLVLSAVNDCLSNHNGRSESCQAFSDNAVSIDTTRLNLLTSVGIWPPQNPWNNVDANGGNGTGAGVWYAFKCTADGAGWNWTGNYRQFMVLYRIETAGNTIVRCIDA